MKLALERLDARSGRAAAAGLSGIGRRAAAGRRGGRCDPRAARAARLYRARGVLHRARRWRRGRTCCRRRRHCRCLPTRRIIEIRLPSGKPGRRGAAALAAAASRLRARICWSLIVTGQLERDTHVAPWVQPVQARGAWLPIWPVDRARLPQWLRARFAARGSRCQPGGAGAAGRAQRGQSAGRAAGDRQARAAAAARERAWSCRMCWPAAPTVRASMCSSSARRCARAMRRRALRILDEPARRGRGDRPGAVGAAARAARRPAGARAVAAAAAAPRAARPIAWSRVCSRAIPGMSSPR